MFYKVLAIDDDYNLLISIKKVLEIKGFQVDITSNPNEVLSMLGKKLYHCILLDVKMPGINGLELLHHIIKEYSNIPVIMISGQSTISIAVESIKSGAYDFIEKPLDPDRLLIVLNNAIKNKNIIDEKEMLYQELQEKYKLIGTSSKMRHLFAEIKNVADTSAKILIYGESGTGKELVARAIHNNSSRNVKPYIKLNCAAIPSELLESELFGYKKGSFTGADKDHKGRFIYADGGTLFLDEIGDMSYSLQSKLLRVLEENEIEMIGENDPYKIDVRIIAATNKDLEKRITEGTFREDLYHRLNVIKIVIPPLRERIDDILPLSFHFISKFNETYNKIITSISRQAQGILLQYKWPGNVRELRNIIEKIVIFSKSNEIGLEDVYNAIEKTPFQTSDNHNESEHTNLRLAKDNFERNYILKILEDNNWKINETAEHLGIDRTNLFKKMQRFGIKKS